MINLIKITNEEELNNFLNNSDYSKKVLKFGASWCGPCKVLAGLFSKIDSEKVGDTIFGEIDIAENDYCESVGNEYGVTNLPTVMFLKDNELKNSKTGIFQLEELYKIINEM